MVAGTQSDIAFDPANTPVAPKATGNRPDCSVNPDISKGATSFAFRPNGCTGAACTAVRALVLATDNTDPIPDGSVLFTCKVNIAATASGSFPLTQTGIILSDPAGAKVTPADTTDGSVTAGAGGPSPTPTTGGSQPCPTAQPAPAGPALWIPDQTGAATTITVNLVSGSAMIAGTQSDITFPANAPIAAKATGGHPDCTVNPDINKGATSFAFRPNGCTGAACTAVRALVLATDNTDPIPDGSVLFTCKVSVATDATGTLPYTFSGVILSDPSGGKVTDAGDQNGSICLSPVGTTSPTPTPTGGAVETPTVKPAPTGPALWIPDQVAPNVTPAIEVKLVSGTAMVAGTQSDITWGGSPAVPIAAKTGAGNHPDCTVNPAINKGATSFAFRPNGCTGTACTAVRALVLATDNTDPIPDGSVLFTCNLVTPLPSTGTLTYDFSGVILSDPAGGKVPNAGAQNGFIFLGGPPLPTVTPTQGGGGATATPTTPTGGATLTPTAGGPTVTATPTRTSTPTGPTATAKPNTPGRGGATLEDEGGCQIGTASHNSSGWLLLIPTVGLLALRRRRR